MKLSKLRSSAPLRLALLILVVAIVDGVVALLVKKPLLYAAIIPALIPLLTVPLVILPLLRAEKMRETKS